MEENTDFVLLEDGKDMIPQMETYEKLEDRANALYRQLDPQGQLILLEEWWGYPDECPNCQPPYDHWNSVSEGADDRPTLWVIHSCHTEPELDTKWTQNYWCQCGYTTCSKCEVAENELFPKNKQYLNEQYYYNFGYWQFATPTKEQIEEMKFMIMMWQAQIIEVNEDGSITPPIIMRKNTYNAHKC